MAIYQGNLLSIRTAVIDKLRLDEVEDTNRVDEWINLAYQQAVQETACLQTCGVATLTADDFAYQIPVEVAMINAVVFVYSDGSISYPLTRVSLDELINYQRGSPATGQQVNAPVYAIVGQNRMEIWPTPAATDQVKFWYVYLPPALVDDDDECAIMEPYGTRLLEAGACVEGAKFKKDPLLPVFQGEYAMWIGRFQAWLNRRETGSSQAFQVFVSYDRPPLRVARDVG